MDSKWLVTKNPCWFDMTCENVPTVRFVCPFVGSQFPGFLAFPSACNGSSRRCPDRVVLLWLRVLRKEDISESAALALLRYLLPPWLLASHRWRRQESPQEWQQMREGFNHRKVALMHYLLLRPIEHCITGLPWNTSGCEIVKTLGCDSMNTFADDALDTPRMPLNIHLWRFPTCFSRSVTCMSHWAFFFGEGILAVFARCARSGMVPDSRTPVCRVSDEWYLPNEICTPNYQRSTVLMRSGSWKQLKTSLTSAKSASWLMKSCEKNQKTQAKK